MNDASGRVAQFLASLESALTRGDAAAAAALFGEECYWRDLAALTWNIHTAEGRPAIAAMLAATARPHGFTLDTATDEDGWFSFETPTGRGRGHVRLAAGGAFSVLTALQELKGFEEKQGATRPEGVEWGAQKGRITWADRRAKEIAELGHTVQPFVLIVGGGQGGIALAARLRRREVPAIVIDKLPRPGDAWRSRYKSLCLHDAVWYDHLPYLPFPAHWPVYTPKDQIGDWLEMYTKIMELNFWGSTECVASHYDDAKQEWEVQVLRDGTPHTLRPKHLVLATGMSGVPNMPNLPGMATFKGNIYHSSNHPGGPGWEGRRCVVVGANNSAHDIAVDLWEHDAASVTMIQRSSTMVARAETLRANGDRGPYSEAAAQRGLSTDQADLIVASTPYAVQPRMQKPIAEKLQETDRAYYDRLRAVGFQLDFGDDGSGLSQKYLRRGSGYYIDVGGSELVADGRIALRAGVEVASFTPDGVTLSSGESLPADLVVFATGYGSMNGWAARLISQEVADRVGKCWGLGSGTTYDPGPWEGELRNMWKPTQQPGLWFHGGNLAQARHYSRYLALQLKARLENIATPVYALPTVHHLG
jgi:putative flavoprotein involved in K+ transport